MKAPVVSVVVPTYQRPRQLLRCLHALFTQQGVPGRVEILVVDDARSPQQRSAVETYARRSGTRATVRYLQPPEGARGPAAARNAGWRAARGEIIAFTDDDTIPAHDWLREGLRAMRPGVTAVWGDVIVPLPDYPTDAERNTAGLDGAEFVTANCFVRRAALLAAGGFDERFKRPWREDSDLYFTLLEAHHAVIPAPAAIVIHPARQAPPGTSIRQHRNLVFDALLYKKHRRLYRQKIAARPPLSYYLTVVAAFTAFGALLGGASTVAATAVGAWCALTLGLALRRLRGTSLAWHNVADIVVSSTVIPLVAVFWRLAGAVRYRVLFA
ncbi:glycosyltransferase family 2 protein [Azoarcus olearius]|uniref:Membrane-anchored glycosyltransferase n=1 Tax=Azoarcus sp. (strain BH72) TaxID=418699 RepID=A1K6G6_AZOSB|nr:glycosyltransferase [Azoarcus olearius]ANQ84991.1 membrane-anchored glycosyltransferase [Azoarcus olearius]CAL94421.1 membrane-anchored glycosyltransferase [Azoarcus olearius]